MCVLRSSIQNVLIGVSLYGTIHFTDSDHGLGTVCQAETKSYLQTHPDTHVGTTKVRFLLPTATGTQKCVYKMCKLFDYYNNSGMVILKRKTCSLLLSSIHKRNKYRFVKNTRIIAFLKNCTSFEKPLQEMQHFDHNLHLPSTSGWEQISGMFLNTSMISKVLI